MPLSQLLSRLRRFWTHDIWAAGLVRDTTLRGRGLALLRVTSITFSGLQEIHVAIRAAALSYSSLLALGPLIAIAVLISGFALGNKDPALAAQGINRVISFIAPQVAQYDKATEDDWVLAHPKPVPGNQAAPAPGAPAINATSEAADAPPPDPEMVQIINNFISS